MTTDKRYFARLALLLVLLAGCSDGRPERVKVSGKVIIDGKPMEYGIVQVLPVGNRAATGKVESDGSFTLGCFSADDGCVPGTHAVRIDGRQPMGLTKVKWFAPKRFAFPGTAQTTVTITEPTEELLIELESGGKRPFEPFVEILARGISEEEMRKADNPF
jgi:hypothetical protein